MKFIFNTAVIYIKKFFSIIVLATQIIIIAIPNPIKNYIFSTKLYKNLNKFSVNLKKKILVLAKLILVNVIYYTLMLIYVFYYTYSIVKPLDLRTAIDIIRHLLIKLWNFIITPTPLSKLEKKIQATVNLLIKYITHYTIHTICIIIYTIFFLLKIWVPFIPMVMRNFFWKLWVFIKTPTELTKIEIRIHNINKAILLKIILYIHLFIYLFFFIYKHIRPLIKNLFFFYIPIFAIHLKFKIYKDLKLKKNLYIKYIYLYTEHNEVFKYNILYVYLNKKYIKNFYIFKLKKKYNEILNKFYKITSLIYKVIYPLLCSLYLYYFIVNYTIYIYAFYKVLILLIFVYQLIIIFIFLNKYNMFGKYTSQIQRFWKRTYILFWIIELFLIILIVTLLLLHFKESEYFFDIKLLTNIYYSHSNIFVIQCVYVYCIIMINYTIIILYKYNNYNNILFFLINCILVILLIIEILKYINLIITYKNIVNIKDTTNINIFFISSSCTEVYFKKRVVFYYLNLFFLLKFWHIIFIYTYFLFVVTKINSSYTKSYDLLSSNLQNFIFLYIFNIMIYIMYIKNIIIYLFLFVHKNYYIGTFTYFFFLKNEFINTLTLIIFWCP